MQLVHVECNVKPSLVPAMFTLICVLSCVELNHYFTVLHILTKCISLIVGSCWLAYYFSFKDHNIIINSNYLQHKSENHLQLKSNLIKIDKIKNYGILFAIIYTSDRNKFFIFIDSVPVTVYKKIRGLAWY